MLVQRIKNEVPEVGAQLRLVHLVDAGFAITVVRAAGMAVDWGMQAEAVRYIARMNRTQLSLLLAGHGYFVRSGRVVWLQPGDVVESDQLLQEPEGYGAAPFEVIVIEWDDGSLFGPARRGEARLSRLDSSAVSLLRAHVSRLIDGDDASSSAHASEWVAALCAQFAEVGFALNSMLLPRVAAPSSIVRVYQALGDAVTQLEKQPSLTEVAEALSLSERQTNRYLEQIAREYTPHHGGWRDTLRDVRLGAAMQYLSVTGLSLARVAQLAGYGSLIAMTHAFGEAHTSTPADVAKRLARRWR